MLTFEFAFAPSTIPPAAGSACLAAVPRCQLRQHQRRCIPQGEHGGNGESRRAAKVGKPILARQALARSERSTVVAVCDDQSEIIRFDPPTSFPQRSLRHLTRYRSKRGMRVKSALKFPLMLPRFAFPAVSFRDNGSGAVERGTCQHCSRGSLLSAFPPEMKVQRPKMCRKSAGNPRLFLNFQSSSD